MGHDRALSKRHVWAFALLIAYEAVTIGFAPLMKPAGIPMATVIATASTSEWIAVGLALLLAALCLRGFFRLRGTTLTAPCLWAALAATSFTFGTLIETRLSGIGLSAFRFALAATTFCPLMAVLGAKRPQDRGWQWVVVTLWIVLVWPAAQAALLPAGIRVELFIAWKIFLWGLIGLGLLNYLPTRHWLAALLVAAGQIVLLQEYLGLASELHVANGTLVGLICFTLAALLVRRRKKEIPNSLLDYENQWRSFRDRYGAFWALRILARVNHAAELRAWPLRLDWDGFQLENEQPNDEQLAELQQTWEGLLRRFVDF